MGLRIVGQEEHVQACLYDSVTGLAFGPVFETVFECEEFLTHWYGDRDPDLRTLSPSDLATLVSEYRAEKDAESAAEVAAENRRRGY